MPLFGQIVLYSKLINSEHFLQDKLFFLKKEHTTEKEDEVRNIFAGACRLGKDTFIVHNLLQYSLLFRE